MLKNLIRRAIVLQAAAFLKFSGHADLSDEVRSAERALNYNCDESRRVGMVLGEERLVCLDLGARNGPQDYLRPYADKFKFIMSDADPAEASRLRDQGYVVVQHIVSDHVGGADLFLTRSPGASSTLHPSGPILNFYAGAADRFEVTEIVNLPTTTIDDIALATGDIHLLKMDIQGAELKALDGMKSTRPLFIQTEVALAQLYDGQGTLFDVGQRLHQIGYICFDLALRRVYPKPIDKYRGSYRHSLGIPLTGDAYFMPDWSRPEGRAMIDRNPKRWEALMLIHGQRELAEYIKDQ